MPTILQLEADCHEHSYFCNFQDSGKGSTSMVPCEHKLVHIHMQLSRIGMTIDFLEQHFTRGKDLPKELTHDDIYCVVPKRISTHPDTSVSSANISNRVKVSSSRKLKRPRFDQTCEC
eukprot:6241865-Amphidinium_carterae.1